MRSRTRPARSRQVIIWASPEKPMSSESTPPRSERLAAYREKRTAGATPEPFGQSGIERPGVFVVQKHAARNLHYDLRIEVDGVLRSWAVPKGPSFYPADKRFAVETEDHPLEYADFEGVIPAGNYGADAMIVWDRGTYRSVDGNGPAEGLEAGKLDLELGGHKLRGRFALVRTKRGKGRDWLLFTVRETDHPVQPLRPRRTPLVEGETVYVIGWRYPDEGRQRVHRGRFVRMDEGSVLVSVEALEDNTVPGLSGSPVIDAKGRVIGLMSAKAGKLQRLAPVGYVLGRGQVSLLTSTTASSSDSQDQP